MTHNAEKDAETLRCIYCQRTLADWPLVKMYPDRCLDCGGWRGYTTTRPLPPAATGESA